MMSLAEQAERTAFHDASLEACSSEGDSLPLEFQDIAIDIGKEEYYRASIILSGVREIRCFGEPVAQLTMEGEGEVLQFHRGEGKALLLLEWHSYKPKTAVLPNMRLSMPPRPSRSRNRMDSLPKDGAAEPVGDRRQGAKTPDKSQGGTRGVIPVTHLNRRLDAGVTGLGP